MEPVNPTSTIEQQPRFIPWEEQLQDHTRKLEEYLQNLLFRGCTLETTIRSSRAVLKHLFDRLQIEDPNHPRGIRQLLVWELLDPGLGSSLSSPAEAFIVPIRRNRLCPMLFTRCVSGLTA